MTHGDTKHITAALSDVADYTDPAWRVALRWATRRAGWMTTGMVLVPLWLAFGLVIAITVVLR